MGGSLFRRQQASDWGGIVLFISYPASFLTIGIDQDLFIDLIGLSASFVGPLLSACFLRLVYTAIND